MYFQHTDFLNILMLFMEEEKSQVSELIE